MAFELKKAQTPLKEVKIYRALNQQLRSYCRIPVLELDEKSALTFQELKKLHPTGVGSMDLRIASIALSNQATVLTRNTRDFEKIDGLSIENWT